MASSTIRLTGVLLALWTVTLSDGMLLLPMPAMDEYTHLEEAAAQQAKATPGPDDFTATVSPDKTEPAFLETTEADDITEPHLLLVCPSSTHGHVYSTIWYAYTPTGLRCGLYLNLVQFYDTGCTQSIANVTHSLTNYGALIIYGDTCNHNATYQCLRSAEVGYRNEEFTFSVANCTVSRVKPPDRRPNAVNHLGNSATRLTISSLILAIGSTIMHSMY